MKIERALSEISEIHSLMAKASFYRGYRSAPVALSGLAGFIAALAQPLFVTRGDASTFVYFWITIAVINILCAGGGIALRYAFQGDSTERRRTLAVVGQAVPGLVAGLLITIGIVASSSERAMAFLPALWAYCYGLGVVSSRPFLPRMIGLVALYYFLAGTMLLRLAAVGTATIFSGWTMGLSFGTAQLLTAAILYWNLERKHHER